ncbi:MAG: glutamine synthetase [Nanoarchaeota archaeon]
MHSRKIRLEYIFIDGYTSPVITGGIEESSNANVRSKTKIVEFKSLDWDEDGDDDMPDYKKLPLWNSDGSSTKQAEGKSSDIVLKPVYVCKDPFRKKDAFLVLCEVYDKDGKPHPSNTRDKFKHLFRHHKNREVRFGFEQEYVLWDDKKINILGWPGIGNPEPQGRYYCGVGSSNVAGREMVEEHMELCISAGLDITGINAEVLLGQWEYQIGGPDVDGLEICDQLWVSRWILHRVSEKYGYVIDFEPKPKIGDWNGSGMHVNFSTLEMREKGGYSHIKEACEKLSKKHEEHIQNYGTGNDKRLTGKHETASITKFSYGVSDRGASIRIPQGVHEKQRGYLEDRRPSSNADPYKIGHMMVLTICGPMFVSPGISTREGD